MSVNVVQLQSATAGFCPGQLFLLARATQWVSVHGVRVLDHCIEISQIVLLVWVAIYLGTIVT